MRTAAYFAGGLLVGFGAAYVALEDRFRKEYDQKAKDLENTYKFVKSLQGEALGHPKNTQQEFEMEDAIASMENEKAAQSDFQGPPDLKVVKDASIWSVAENVEDIPQETTDYHKIVAAKETPVEQFVSGGINDYGVSYIEEEEYQEDDGRLKEQVQIYLTDTEPIFMMNGEPLENWDECIGDSIIVDFYKLVPPGVEPVLYVRNHRTDVDYEVVRQEP